MKKYVPSVILFITFLLIWDLAIRSFNISPFILPSPKAVFEIFADQHQELLDATLQSALIAVAGFVLSILIGTIISLLMSQSKIIELSIYPYAIFLQAVPIVAIAPVFILWFGAGTKSMILISMIISLFPIVTNVSTGLRSIEKDVMEMMWLYKASRWQILWKVRFPSAVPNFVIGAKTSAGLAVVGAIVGEYFTGLSGESRGLAFLIQSNQQNANYPFLFATSISAALLGFIIFSVVSTLGEWIIKKGHFERKVS
ncbi:MAG: ABC transporter permease [Lentisphaeria bacterium]|nr:ABC transporter permease [Lentisphaeria bacterium]